MTELDTAAIRARRYPFLPDMGEVIALCDALDAARAAAERANAHREGHALAAGEAIVRAEAAEAALASERGEWNTMLNEANERYEAAEARIATALAAYKAGNGTRCAADMARALTEGTGQ